MIQAPTSADDLVADLVLRQGIDKAHTFPVPIGTQHYACAWCDGIEIPADVRIYVDGAQVTECCRACARSDRVVNAVIEHDTRDGDPHRVTAEIDVVDPPKAIPAAPLELAEILTVVDRHGHPFRFSVQADVLTDGDGLLLAVEVGTQVVAEFDTTSPGGRAAMLALAGSLIRAAELSMHQERAA